MTYCGCPSQNTTVAIAIRIPGMPKAQLGPYFFKITGISSVEKNEPKLIAK